MDSTFPAERLPGPSRNNGAMQSAAPASSAPIEARPAPRARRRSRRPARHGRAQLARAIALLGLHGVVTTVLLTVAAAASAPTQYVPARSGGWAPWLAGPLAGLNVG
ncbi:MAG: hypothetical protein QOF54_1091, partial [Solirubrobacteraceae bacterium]|nr:hypothetical protein [Solirubrobacteraceae bacterium]